MQAPGGPDEDRSGGFHHGGWTVPHFDEQVGAFMAELMTPPFDLVLGRRTYDVFAAYWPQTGEDSHSEPLNTATQYVASRGRPPLSWDRSVLMEGDVVEGVAALNEQDGPELQVHGSGDLLQTLFRTGLVDRFRLLLFPVVLGSGRRLFAVGTAPAGLRLVGGSTSPSGVVTGTWEPVGEVVTGSLDG